MLGFHGISVAAISALAAQGGDAVATGATLTATVSLIAETATGGAAVASQTLPSTASLITGTAMGGAVADGATLTALSTLIGGAVVGGATLIVTVSFFPNGAELLNLGGAKGQPFQIRTPLYETRLVQWPLRGLLARTEFDFVLETAPRWPTPIALPEPEPLAIEPDAEPEALPAPPPPDPATLDWPLLPVSAAAMVNGVIIDMRGVRIARKRREARAVELAMAHDRELVAAYLEKKGLRL